MNPDRKPDSTIDAAALKAWRGYCVYGWRRSDKYLYIGMSSCGLSRPLNHSVIGVKEDIGPDDYLDVWHFESDDSDTWARAAEFETAMIRRHRPTYNVTDNPDRVPRQSKQQTAWDAYVADNKRRNEEELLAGWSEKTSWEEC